MLLSPFRVGRLELKNRMVMAPMTRGRALVAGNVPNPLAPTYYAQRASAGLLITEATQVSPQGVGYIRTPGLHSPEQVAGWRRVTEAVHDAGGVIFAQLWHVGRVSHPDFHEGRLPVAPSAIGYEGEVFTFQGKKRVVTPRALETQELPGIVEQFRRAAENAKDAGFDGVEVHGSNGYLLDQFLRDGSNQRTDAYGGSIENRARFPLEVARAVVEVWGAERVGYRLLPQSFPYSGVMDSTPVETFTYMARALNRLGLGYLHVTESVSGPGTPSPEKRISPKLREVFQGTFLVNGGYDARTGESALVKGEADLVAYGVPFLSNPDLPERFRRQAPLNPADASTFFTGDEKGYADYPALG
ncbi:NADH:flavin oxidoreductase [Myxococcus stipitatus DSM 14675]|uniref:NADH:flavin oxidoreductase n=2 Tax=Myxococcus stipitatus TaxID=83455 RepID=L7UAI7_MYXSD|nr:NADH:flavin oxidoreductase [Myxococcus stipitatus DSM 14675]